MNFNPTDLRRKMIDPNYDQIKWSFSLVYINAESESVSLLEDSWDQPSFNISSFLQFSSFLYRAKQLGENVDYSWCNLLGTRMVHVKSIALILKWIRDNWYWSDYGWPWPENTDFGYSSIYVPTRKHFHERFTVLWNKETHKRHTRLKYFEME